MIREHYNFAAPDERLRSCKPRPAKRPIVTDNDVALIITEAFEYGDDCSSKNTATWKSIDDAAARSKKLNDGVKAK